MAVKLSGEDWGIDMHPVVPPYSKASVWYLLLLVPALLQAFGQNALECHVWGSSHRMSDAACQALATTTVINMQFSPPAALHAIDAVLAVILREQPATVHITR